MEQIERDDVRRLVHEEDAQVVEVLPRSAYEWAHLPGAQHLPYSSGFDPDDARRVLTRDRPVIAYCSGFT
jgi:rhodanese-related sulfurtransferase